MVGDDLEKKNACFMVWDDLEKQTRVFFTSRAEGQTDGQDDTYVAHTYRSSCYSQYLQQLVRCVR